MPKFDWSEYQEESPSKQLEKSSSSWGSLFKGLSEGYPESIKSGANAVSDLAGAHPFEDQQLGPTDNWQQTLGRLVGQGAGYSTLSAPLVAAGSAAIPGVMGAALGAGLSGAALTPGDYKNRITGGLASAALPVAGKAASLTGKLGKNYLFGEKPREAADILQKAYKKNHAKAVSDLNEVSTQVSKRGINEIPVDKSVFKRIKEEIPDKTKAFADLLKKAESGDYRSLRELQADLRIKSEDLMGSSTYAERNLGKLVAEIRDDVNNSIASHLENTGNKDLASKLTEGMSKYRDVMSTYHGNKRISKLVGPDEEVPDSLYKILGRDTRYFKELRKKHPELDKSLKVQKLQKQLGSLYKKALALGHGAAVFKVATGSNQHNE